MLTQDVFWLKIKSWWAKDTNQQELSYRKQIARQLRTQYAEGINDNTVTLKSRSLKVTGNGTIE